MTVLALISAASAAPGIAETLAQAASSQEFAPTLRNFLVLTLLAFVPVFLIGVTAFTRIIIVLSLLRHALGLQQTPPTIVLIALSMFLTLFTMAPVMQTVNQDALHPFLNEEMSAGQALERGFVPLREFMVRQTRESDLQVILEVANAPKPNTIEDIQAVHLIPAFMLSELRTAFLIGFVIFLPFLMIDLVVSAILMALGMIMVPPTTISLPLKILVFVLVDGWALLIRALLSSFQS
jgi:flagellar biosynthetic protein FliP